MKKEIFYTYDDELNIITKYTRNELIDRINDYIINFDDKEYLIKDGDNYSYGDFNWKLGNTYSREHLFLVVNENSEVLYKSF